MIIRPPATIFDLTTIATGLLVFAAAAILGRAGFVRTATVPSGLFGLGALLVGIFPGK